MKIFTISKEQISPRDLNLDLVKSLAVVIMILSNTAFLFQDVSFNNYYRLLCSLSAPFFLFCVGMSFHNKLGSDECSFANKRFVLFLKRGSYLFLLGGIIDLFYWNIVPFFTSDILYLIGLCLPLLYIFSLIKSSAWQLLICFSILLLSELLRAKLHYNFKFEYLLLSEYGSRLSYYLTYIPRNFIFEGWFPLFPWVFYAFFGFLLKKNLASLKQLLGERNLNLCCRVLWVLTLLLVALEQYFPENRYRNIEIFYPPSTLFITYSTAIAFLVFFLFSSGTKILLGPVFNKVRLFFVFIGQNSLIIYLVHLLVIRIISFSKIDSSSGELYLFMASLVFVLSSMCSILIRNLRKIYFKC